MIPVSTDSVSDAAMEPGVLHVDHFVKGQVIQGTECRYGPAHAPFAMPRLDLDALVWPRSEPGPAFDLPLDEIMDVLVATGERLRTDPDGHLGQALEHMVRAGTLDRRILERTYAELHLAFKRDSLDFQIEQAFGGPDVLDGWREVQRPNGRPARIRAFPPRLIHVMAGNTPGVAAISIIRGALVKGINLLKLPSNDLFSAVAILRAMAAVAPGHPVPRSFSAVYWRGGDAAVEGLLCRPQFFDKLVAWGGDSAIRNAKNYVGPGFELVSFDPKTSISLIGREAFASEASLADVAARAATDATPYNQTACTSTRIHFIEANIDQADRYCELLQRELGVDRPTCSAMGPRVPAAMREEIEGLRMLEPDFRVWGGYEGAGLVIRSEEPVDFYPDCKVVNVVPVENLARTLRYVTVATQTVTVYPPSRKAELRDRLASSGAQRVVSLGTGSGGAGLPHDGFVPLHRFVRWVTDED